MKSNVMYLLVIAILKSFTICWSSPPIVSNVLASQRPGTKLVDIRYDVADADGGTVTVEVHVSSDGGLTYLIPATTFTGAVGQGVALGSNRQIVWNAGADWGGNFIASTKVRVTAHDGSSPPAPLNMVYIPGGPFQMGDNLDLSPSAPVHNVDISPFFIDQREVDLETWTLVKGWANVHGYNISGGLAKSSRHPVHSVTWYDAIKWCNAKSEMEGLAPCYYTDGTQSTVIRTTSADITTGAVKWSASGYRLPTEAEWEKAARGGLTGRRYPWGDNIGSTPSTAQANYNFPSNPWYTGGTPYTSETDSYPSNDFGVFGVAGNVFEWCWDLHGNYIFDVANPTGPTTGSNRVLRGGDWQNAAADCRVSQRASTAPSNSNNRYGFRTVRRPN